MQLIPEAKKLHRLWSVQLAFINAALGTLWLFVPAVQNLMPTHTYVRICVGLAAGTLLARLIRQKLKVQSDDKS